MTCRYRFISAHRATFGVTRLCRVLGVRRPGFYEWLAAEPARAGRAAAEDQISAEIAEIHRDHRGAYGSKRVSVELRRRGRRVNRKRVERIMRRRGIVGITRRRRRSLTKQDMSAPPAPDLLGRHVRRDTRRRPGRQRRPRQPARPRPGSAMRQQHERHHHLDPVDRHRERVRPATRPRRAAAPIRPYASKR
jgi:hypothetical protein